LRKVAADEAEECRPASQRPEDRHGLTPLIYSNVNPYGVLHLDINQGLRDGDDIVA
jgi:hypothetical protein